MNKAVETMLRAYGDIRTARDKLSALREVVQRIALHGLQRGRFFDKAAFYGGTALRLLYGLDRFSEDMDFCLLSPDPQFTFSPYFDMVSAELERYGLRAVLEEKSTGPKVTIESAFVKQNTYQGLLVIGQDAPKVPKNSLVKVRLEVDKANPQGASITKKLVQLPVPFMITTMSEGSLFAGKIHALLARAYMNRVKGRDFYDFVFYTSRNTPVNMVYLENKLKDSNHYKSSDPLTMDTLQQLLNEKFETTDFKKAKEDVRPFLKPENTQNIDDWSPELFKALSKTLIAEDSKNHEGRTDKKAPAT